FLLLLGEQHHLAEEQQRHHERPPQQRVHHRAAVAQVLAALLEEHQRRRTGFHAASPSAEPIALTNASSSWASPVCARSSSGVPAATTRPRATTTMWSHSAPTSGIRCDENTMHLPCPRSRRISSRIARVASTPRPLV